MTRPLWLCAGATLAAAFTFSAEAATEQNYENVDSYADGMQFDNLAVTAAPPFVVTNTNATGPGSLHKAIADANALPGIDRIIFNIPGSGIHRIHVTKTALPTITDPVIIDGYSQPGSRKNTLKIGSNAVLRIQLYGEKPAGISPTVSNGIVVQADDCIVRGLIVAAFYQQTDFEGARYGGYGMTIRGARNVVEGDFIGTDGSADASLGNTGGGIYLVGADNRIGGNMPAAHNVIAGNLAGIDVRAAEYASDNKTTNLLIAGNQIGTNEGQNSARGNKMGVSVNGVFAKAVIGGTDPSFANLISGNGTGIGCYVENGRADGVTVKGNLIGVEPNAASPQVNQTIGIALLGSDNVIGGLEPGAGNTIAYNDTGIYVGPFSAVRNPILSNRIYASGTIGIDLDRRIFDNGTETSNALGPTLNDSGDADTGGNNLQNYPIITQVVTDKTVPPGNQNTRINGSFNSTPDSDFTLQFFRYNLQPRVLGSMNVHTDAQGNAQFSFPFYLSPTQPVQNGSHYSATATDAAGNTSEFLPANGPVQLANISTRGNVGTQDQMMFGGFIIRSDSPKKVIIRALGPSLPAADRLADPYLELYDGSQTLLAKNDDWRVGQEQAVMDSGVPPSSDVESAIVTTLPAGSYTAQVRGADGGTGTGIVEVYDLDPLTTTSGRLVNVSTRAVAGTDDHVLIGGIIVAGAAAERVIVRAIGPDLGVPGALPDPMLELYDGNGSLIASDDNWRESQQSEIAATHLAPHDNRDSAIVTPLAPGSFTAVLRGKGGTTGVALVEFYDLKN